MSKRTQDLTTKTDLSDSTDFVAFVRNESGVYKDYKFSLGDIAKVNSKSDTYANISTAKTNGTLVANSWYYLTDKNIYVQAISSSEIALQGYINGYDADYQTSGDYTDITIANGFTVNATGTNRGIWYSTFVSGGGTLNTGDVMIYNDTHYLSKTGAIGTAPSGDTTNWEVVSSATDPTTRGYILSLDLVYYNFDSDTLLARFDRKGNEIYGSTLIDLFPWGNNGFTGNVIGNQAAATITGLYNHRGDFVRADINGGTLTSDEDATCDISDLKMNFYDAYDFSGNTSGTPYKLLGHTLEFSKTIATASVLTLNGTPVTLVDQDTASALVLLSAEFYMAYNSATYATNTTLVLYTSGSATDQATGTNYLASANTSYRKFTLSNTDDNLAATSDLLVTVSGGNPTTGDSDITICGTYKFIAPEVAG